MQDEEIKELRKRLETAINETLTDSAKINLTIQELRDRGYDTFLIIEATIGFNKIEDHSPDKIAPASAKSTVKLRLSTQDAKFLRSLKISPD